MYSWEGFWIFSDSFIVQVSIIGLLTIQQVIFWLPNLYYFKDILEEEEEQLESYLQVSWKDTDDLQVKEASGWKTSVICEVSAAQLKIMLLLMITVKRVVVIR